MAQQEAKFFRAAEKPKWRMPVVIAAVAMLSGGGGYLLAGKPSSSPPSAPTSPLVTPMRTQADARLPAATELPPAPPPEFQEPERTRPAPAAVPVTSTDIQSPPPRVQPVDTSKTALDTQPVQYVQSRSVDSNPTAGFTPTGIPQYVGPRGGVYHYSKNGNKVYSKKK